LSALTNYIYIFYQAHHFNFYGKMALDIIEKLYILCKI